VRTVGDLLAGRYRLEALLGRGGAGVVFRARDERTGGICAVKELNPSGGDESLGRFKREFRAASRLDHPHCLPVYQLDRDQGRWFYTMQFVAGGSLQLAGWRRWQDMVPLALQILAGLDHIHARKIVHRDVKPQNILLDQAVAGGPPVVKLADFGIAKVSEVDQPPLGSVMGSLAYLAPEQRQGGPVDPRTDLFSLGVVLYEALGGRNPLGPGGDGAFPPLTGLPPGLAAIVSRLLEAAPEDRYPTAALAHDDLRGWWSDQPGAPVLPAAPPLTRAPHLATARLVGRDAELASLESFVAGPDDGGGPWPLVWFLEGAAGMGKSRLVGEVVRLARSRGQRVETGTWQAEAGGRWPLEWMLRLGQPPERSPRMTETYGRTTLIDGEAPAGGGDERWGLLRRIADTLIAQGQPLLIALEDAHWADEHSVAVLSGLIRSLAQARAAGTTVRVSLILTHRPAPATSPLAALRRAAQGTATGSTLQGLDQERSAELVASMLMRPVAEPVRAFVARLVEGGRANPLHLTQTLHLLLSTGGLVPRGGAWDVDPGALVGARLPQTVTEAIGDRAARLSTDTKRLLATAAILGRELEVPVAVTAARLDQGTALDCLDEAVRAGFVLEQGERFLFTHDRFRDTILQALSPVDQRDLHRRAAEALETLHGQDPERAAALAHHHAGAGAPALAYQHSLRAAAHEEAAFMFGQAAEHHARALALAAEAQITPPDSLIERHADACLQAGRYDEALRGFSTRLERTTDPLARAELFRKCAEVEFRRGNTTRAEVMLEEVMRALGFRTPPATEDTMPGRLRTLALLLRMLPRRPLLPGVDPARARHNAVFVRSGLWLGEVLYFRDWGRAVFYGTAALRVAPSLGPSSELAIATASAGLVAASSGVRPLARFLHERARRHVDGKSPIDRAWVHILHALSAACHADARGALAEVAQAEALLQRTHEPWRLRQLLAVRGDMEWCLGDLAAADRTADKGLRLAAELHDGRGRGWALYIKGKVASRCGHSDEAHRLLETAATHAEQSGDVTYRLNCEASRAFDLLLAGRLEEATALSAAAAREYAARRLVDPVQPADGIFLAAAGLTLARDRPASPALLREVTRVRVLRWHRARCMGLTRPMFWAGSAAVEQALGRPRRALALFDQAARTARTAGVLGTLLDVHALAARVLPEPHRERHAADHAALLARLSPGVRSASAFWAA
jgi:tetratricopeptide (TPR) repeat protein